MMAAHKSYLATASNNRVYMTRMASSRASIAAIRSAMSAMRLSRVPSCFVTPGCRL